jgi:hypothetical protein
MELSITPNEALTVVFALRRNPEELKTLRSLLEEPFDEEDVKWKPQQISYKDKENPKGQAASYADARVYSDRLNEVVGVHNWFQIVSSIVTNPFPKKVSKWGEDEKYVDMAKIVTTVSVGIIGIGLKTDVGESWLDDENAATIAYSQAFKRACYPFGPGRYFYDLPKIWHPIDKKTKQFKDPGPVLPEWAKPKKLCQDCGERIAAVEIDVKGDGVLKPFSVARLIENSKLKYDGKKLCYKCQVKRSEARKAATSGRVGNTANNKANGTGAQAAA